LKFYTLTIIILISFFLNGCIIDRLKQRIYAKNQIEKQKQIIKHRESKTTKIGSKASKIKKSYEPSKATAPIYAEPDKIEVKPIEKNQKSNISRKKRYAKHIKNKVKLKLEPYSIEDSEQDPELLGPQTTISSNPLTNNSKNKDSKKKKI